jgi:hypothetical protein
MAAGLFCFLGSGPARSLHQEKASLNLKSDPTQGVFLPAASARIVR